MSSPKLKPCPFCGSKAVIKGGNEGWCPTPQDVDSGGNPYSVVCVGCGCTMSAIYEYADIFKKWNNRDGVEETDCDDCVCREFYNIYS